MVLRSEQFDDVYFSVDDGMAETRHVFIVGNDLHQAWDTADISKRFVIAETGFGTGLNFFTTWKDFEIHAPTDLKLTFVSVEKYPLSKDVLRDQLAHWDNEIGEFVDQFLSLYPMRVPGPHIVDVTDRVRLVLWIGDIHDVLPQWDGYVDAWFLDGFTPAKNPDMWGDDLYQTMARLSHAKTSYATFTAAGFVRRGLVDAGFSVEKSKGFGRKRDMVSGRFIGNVARSSTRQSGRRMAIIGGGLAGCAMAYYAKKSGFDVALYEQGDDVACGASAGKLGMVNPRLSAIPTMECDFYTAAFAHAVRELPQFQNIDLYQCGSVMLCIDDDKKRRFDGYCQNLGWHPDHIHRKGDDIFYPDAMAVSPYKLCHELIKGVDVRFHHPVDSIDDIDADYIVVANSHDSQSLFDADLNLQPVRGQASWIKKQPDINHNICFGGYLTPKTEDGFHVLGASFQPWDNQVDIRDEDHVHNIEKYNKATGGDLSTDDVVGGWAALRSATKDRFPMIGHYRGNIYMSVAHGSHGIMSSLYGARIILSQIEDDIAVAHRSVVSALCPKRFHKH